MKRRLGNLERQLLAYAQLRKVRELRTGDLLKPLGITAKQERELYSRLARAGLIAQVRRGLYLVPRELPLGGAWTPDEALALNTLMSDRAGRYQICGPNAFNRYGFSEQIPNRVYAYNDKLSGERTIGRGCAVAAQVGEEAATVDRSDSLDTHGAETRQHQSPLGRRSEREGVRVPIRLHIDDPALLRQAIDAQWLRCARARLSGIAASKDRHPAHWGGRCHGCSNGATPTAAGRATAAGAA